jgi:hypothetical protein
MGVSAAVESRTACPACGGQVHPIAGRCKHCKADLTRLRAGHAPVAPAVARPALVALGGGHDGSGHSHSQAVHAPLPLGSPPPHAVVASAAPADDGAPGTWSARWPLLVAALAIIAILASVAMLVFGGNDEKKTSRAKRFNGPAPQLTPTDPGAHQVAPQGGDLQRPTVPDPDPAPRIPPPPPPSVAADGPRDIEDFMRQSVATLCERVKTCSGFDSSVTTLCAMAPTMIPQMVDSIESMCPDYDAAAARVCVDSMSRFPCPSGGATDTDQMSATLMGLAGCQRVCASAFQGYAEDNDLQMSDDFDLPPAADFGAP